VYLKLHSCVVMQCPEFAEKTVQYNYQPETEIYTLRLKLSKIVMMNIQHTVSDCPGFSSSPVNLVCRVILLARQRPSLRIEARQR
jgi:hypothetical protein